MVLDFLIQHRTRERRFVAFVVAPLAVAVHVDDDILLELLPKLDGQLRDVEAGVRIFAVDVEDRHFEHLGDVSAVARRSAVAGPSREADLIVDDDMDRAAGLVALKLREVERLGDETLPRDGGVAVDQERHAQLPLRIDAALLGPRPPFDDRVDRFEMARIRRQGQVDLVSLCGDAIAGEAEVVLDVAVAHHRIGEIVFVELGEDVGVGLGEDVREDVEPTAVSHAHDDFEDAGVGAAFDDGVEERDRRLGAFHREALLALKLRVQKLLEQLGVVQFHQDADPFASALVGQVVARLHFLLEPFANLRVGDVHVFDADGSAVGFAEGVDQLAERAAFEAEEMAGVERLVHVEFGEPEAGEVELRREGRRRAERIKRRQEVAQAAVGVDELDDAGLLRGARRRGRLLGDAEFEAVEEEPPRFRDGGRVGLPTLVLGVEKFEVQLRGEVRSAHKYKSVG